MDKTTLLWDLLKYVGVIGNLIGLMVWGHHSIEMYLENPTASSVIMNYGDEGDMQTRFPVISEKNSVFTKWRLHCCPGRETL